MTPCRARLVNHLVLNKFSLLLTLSEQFAVQNISQLAHEGDIGLKKYHHEITPLRCDTFCQHRVWSPYVRYTTPIHNLVDSTRIGGSKHVYLASGKTISTLIRFLVVLRRINLYPMAITSEKKHIYSSIIWRPRIAYSKFDINLIKQTFFCLMDVAFTSLQNCIES